MPYNESFIIQDDVWVTQTTQLENSSEDLSTGEINRITLSYQGVPKTYQCETDDQKGEARIAYNLLT